MTIELLITLIVSFLIGYLGVIVFLHNIKNFNNILFFLICLTTIFWSITNYFSWIAPPEKALFWIRLVLFFAVFHLYFYFIFINNYPLEKLRINNIKFIILSFLTIVIAGLTLTNKVFESIVLKDDIVLPVPGKFMPVFAIFILSTLATGLITAFIKLKIIEKSVKIIWGFISISLVLSYVLIVITQFIFVNIFHTTKFIPYGPLFMLPIILGIGYSIIKYQALNVRIIGTEIFVLFMLSLFITQTALSKTITDLIVNIIILVILSFLGLLLIKSVLTEVEQREKLAEINQKLETLNRIKSEFLSFASHQVKAPMAVVKGYAELIAEGIENVPEQAKDFAKKIKDSVDKLLALVEEFIDYRKIEEGKIDLNFEEVEIISLIKEIVNNFMLLAKEKNLELSFETNLEQIILKVDKLRFTQIIQNLIDNAIKYTPQGWVKVNVYKENNELVIGVNDSGIGMSKELQSKLFGEFVRDPSIKKEIRGTGLGLYIVKNLVEAHQGKIWAESEGEGKGSKFYVSLPSSLIVKSS
ncbi:MAG: hypothetical protein KatS3mg095_0653 [Candidatus Parcubacteria bacterium]|nr:MAG: hypothetical protein KatS3mg095_0653 [Candidatus Parcubacteria bacterium]